MNIDELELPTRTLNCLHAEGIDTLEDLSYKRFSEILALKGMGINSVLDLADTVSNFLALPLSRV